MSEPITYVGIDAHKVELHVALLAPDASAPVTWKVQNEARAVERLRRKLEKAAAGPVACCYEAGPCGYVLQRQLERGQVQCQVIAPALVPRKPGERIKTDRRDARKLAELHRAEGCTVRVARIGPAPARQIAASPRAHIRVAVDPGAALGQWSDVAASGRPGRPGRLPAGDRSTRGPTGGVGCAVGDRGHHRSVSGAGGLVALLPGHRHADRDAAARRAARCAAVSDGAGADGVSGAGARGALERAASSPGADHEDGQHAGAAAGGGSGVALSAPARRQPDAGPAAERATATGDCAGGQGAAAVVSPLPAAGRAQAGPGRHGGGGPRAGRISVGGLAPGDGMNRGAVRHSALADRRRARGMRSLGRQNHRGGRRVKPLKRGSFASLRPSG